MAASLVPSIIVLALGAGALGFPDALCLLLDVPKRSPVTDIAICVLAIAVVTAQALGAMLLARFVRKSAARAGGDAHAPPPRPDRFARTTLVVSLGVAFIVAACLLVASGAGGLLCLVAADVARKMKNPVIAALATAAAVLPCVRPLLRVFCSEEDHSHGTGTGTVRFANMTHLASFTAAAAFLLAVSGGLCMRRGSLVDVSFGVAAVVGACLLARFALTRSTRNAAGANTRRLGGKLTWVPPFVAVVALICCLVLTTDAPLNRAGPTAPYTHDHALLD